MSGNSVDTHDLQKVLSRMANRHKDGGGESFLPDIQKDTRLDRIREYTNALSARGFQYTSTPKTARSARTETAMPAIVKPARSESVELYCGPCLRDGIQHDVAGYCIDCSEYFCEDCIKHHKNLKITKSHVVRDRKKMSKLKPLSTDDENLEACPLHDGEMIRYFCKDHDDACCAVCATLKHRTCQDLIYIPQMNIKKTKKNCGTMIKQINSLIGQYQKVKEDTKKNVQLLDLQKSDFQQGILKVHQDILDLLHQIERELVDNLDSVYNSEMGYLTARMTMTDEAVDVLRQAASQLEMYKQNSMDSRTFLHMKKLTKEVSHYETLLSDIREKNTQTMKLTFQKDKHVKNFLKDTKWLGCVEISDRPDRSVIPLTQFKIKSRSDKIEVCDITGSTVLPDGRVVLADMYNESLKLVDSSYKMISQSKLSSDPWDVCCISADQVVVSLPRERKLQFYAIGVTMRPLKRIGQNDSVKGSQYYGLAYHQERLYVTCPKDEPPNVKIMDMQGRQLNQINANQQEQSLFSDPLYIAVNHDGKTIYVSDSGNNSIIAVDLTGNDQAKVFQVSGNNPPGGIIAVPDGNIYFCGFKSNTLERLSQDLGSSEIVHGSEGLFSSPQSISYCTKERRLIVAMQKQDTVRVLQLF